MIPSQTISLNNFEGPLDLLLHLIQRNEINIYDIRIQRITEQFLGNLESIADTRVDVGAEFLGITSTLLLLKSQKLLPKAELSKELLEEDPRFTLIHQLLEYCRFKEISKEFIEREEKESEHYPRGIFHPPETKKEIPPMNLTHLQTIFGDILKRQVLKVSAVVEDDRWHVADKIAWIKQELALYKQLSFQEIFSVEMEKLELIVTFLAVLELMKCNEIDVFKEGIKLAPRNG